MKKLRSGLFILIQVLFAVVMSGCGAVPAGEDNGFHSITVFAMDTVMELSIYGDREILDEAADLITAYERLFSVTDEDSDIYKLNTEGRADVSAETADILEKALGLCQRTDGAFDITVYPLVKAWGFTTGEYRVPEKEEIDSLLMKVDHTKVYLQGLTVSLPEGVMLDLGGVAKGYVGDKVIGLFESRGVTHAIINLGGNVAALGAKPDGSPYRIAVTDPKGDGNYVGVLSVEGKCVVTSGNYERYFEKDGVRYHHIFDTSAGYPAEGGFTSVTVVGDSGTVCDAMSTALFVMGKDKAFEYCLENTDFEALFVTGEDEVYVTGGLKNSIELLGRFTGTKVRVIGDE